MGSKEIKEYEMLRQEILQYMEEYQSIRNMMYIVTFTILVICLTGDNVQKYTFLIPLVVILPSYLAYFSYKEGVIIDATYLMVFYETNPEIPFKWETRIRKLREDKMIKTKTGSHKLSYIICALLCVILYLAHIDTGNYIDIVVGLISCIVCFCFFVENNNIDDAVFINKWKEIKQMEERNTSNNLMRQKDD
ncbi:MAG: hypothetical protein NC393_07865 [Clostridium sp.]|nr:hypothetical protein [Clostridium sp.]